MITIFRSQKTKAKSRTLSTREAYRLIRHWSSNLDRDSEKKVWVHLGFLDFVQIFLTTMFGCFLNASKKIGFSFFGFWNSSFHGIEIDTKKWIVFRVILFRV